MVDRKLPIVSRHVPIELVTEVVVQQPALGLVGKGVGVTPLIQLTVCLADIDSSDVPREVSTRIQMVGLGAAIPSNPEHRESVDLPHAEHWGRNDGDVSIDASLDLPSEGGDLDRLRYEKNTILPDLYIGMEAMNAFLGGVRWLPDQEGETGKKSDACDWLFKRHRQATPRTETSTLLSGLLC